MRLKAYAVERNGIKGICGPSIWGLREDKNETVPLVYLRKPKWMSDEQFSRVVKNISLHLPVGEF